MVPVPGRALLRVHDEPSSDVAEVDAEGGRGALFLTAWWGKRLSEVSLSFLLQRHARAAGIGKVHPHALRHACATHLIKGGADVRHVQAILGHKKLETTALYTRVVVEDPHEVLEHAHPREQRPGRRKPDK